MAEEEDVSGEPPGGMPEGMTYKKIFLSFDGRINRSVYWLKGILPLLAASILIMAVFGGAVFFSMSMMGFDMFGPSRLVLTTSRGQVEVKKVSSNLDEEILVTAGAPSGDFAQAPFFEISFDVSLGAAAADLPKPLSFEKTIDAGSFSLTAIQTLEKEPFDGPIQWRIYAGRGGEPPSPTFFMVIGVINFAIMIFLTYCSFAIGCKRCHDRGRSGWFQLIVLIPLVGQIWLFIELGLLKGDEGENIYGPDPLAASS